jgi:hypothetical protein
MRNDFDVDYIRNWVKELGAEHLFEKCLREIGK